MTKVTYEVRVKHRGGRNSSWIATLHSSYEAERFCKEHKSWFQFGYKIMKITTVTRKQIFKEF